MGMFGSACKLWRKRKELWWGQYLYTIPLWIITFPLLVPVYVVYRLLGWIWRIICSIGRGFRDGIIEFGGVFGEYLEVSYKDYCPGIDWEEGEEK